MLIARHLTRCAEQPAFISNISAGKGVLMTDEVNSWNESPDHGYRCFFRAVCGNDFLAAYGGRVSAAEHPVESSQLMAFEAFCLHEVVVIEDEELLVFCHNPFTQYVAEQFCNLTLGSDKWTRIGANTTEEERSKIIRAWADKYPKIRVLLVPIK